MLIWINLEKIGLGVSQGSALGPLLFFIHINDLQNKTSLKVLNFADEPCYIKDLMKTHIYKTVTTLTLNFKKSKIGSKIIEINWI